MGYLPPSLNALSQSVVKIKQDYKRKDRAPIVSLLELTQKILTMEEWPDVTPDAIHKVSLGLWTLCREKILRPEKWWQRYHFFEPDFSQGSFISTGSTLYTLLSTGLNIDKKNNDLDDKTKLIFLEKFYNFFFNTDPQIHKKLSPWRESLHKNNVSVEEVKKTINRLMQEILANMPRELANLLHAIPTDQCIHTKMSHFNDTYNNKKRVKQAGKSALVKFFNQNNIGNKQRKFSAQMAQAISSKALPNDEATDLSRSQRVKMGALLYIMETIKSGYWIFSPQTSSELYKLCSDALNNELKNFPEYTELECLLAFRNYIVENETLDSLEQYGKKYFGQDNYLKSIDVKVNRLINDLKIIVEKLDYKNDHKTNWPAAHFFAQLGAMIAAAPFFGVGSLLGLTLSESNAMIKAKVQSGNGLNTLGTAALGLSHSYLGLMAANYIIQSTLIRAFGKACEKGGMVIGYGIGYGTGTFFDLFYKGAKSLCLSHIHHYDPVLIKNADADFLKTVLNLPPGILKPNDQKHLEKLAEENFAGEEVTDSMTLRK